MKAYVTSTSDARVRVTLVGVSSNIENFLSNLGGRKIDGAWIFSKADGRHVPAALKDEGYEIEFGELL